ncbi:tRNA preQ1(34) S-adenosylmethionine ribosyltransferase-isomerase QueA [Methylacidimicrobium tartarophylax]|uniref:S-adenosylmethionine:tRNA ribosyltransferase-isomerase n=1 Tax=Methylacidimicrobium tartarophylax TaxID=1041768 RepID=A0A5E6MC33_9BACT|nr:tRNA preQ1(34) S-adenosylmethionine ribosyltransferase-isomerase QueA [Methylacidimicrobium tartarophylax]VVM07005.1 S-adenosylmethionine:tRNA ribosyltransferase-isomerase [Methylacidimicrobium tartarophylax]
MSHTVHAGGGAVGRGTLIDRSVPDLAPYSFVLPEERIALAPTSDRAEARLMLLDRRSRSISHHRIRDLPTLLDPDDLLILNDSRVIPAYLPCREPQVSFLLLEEPEPLLWKALAEPARKASLGRSLLFVSHPGTADEERLTAEVVEVGSRGERLLRFSHPFLLERFGSPPLPPYIRKRRKHASVTPSFDLERYQTVFARRPGSVAAPTAGLHFTPGLLARLPHAFVTLHVGPGTFRPIGPEEWRTGRLHPERLAVPPGLAEAAQAARRLVAVGTTVARVLESVPDLRERSGTTDLFLRPPYSFQRTGALLTNFHLPRSSLFLLVSAFAGLDLLHEAYREAVACGYRFYSYGDAMLIL